MALRTTRSTITFIAPFSLRGVRLPQAAGTYHVDMDDEIIEGKDQAEYRPVATRLYLRVGGSIRIRAVDRQDLQAACERDRRYSRQRPALPTEPFQPSEGSAE